MQKTSAAFTSCDVNGIIDDMSEIFPLTSVGSSWSGYTDQVMGGLSFGHLTRHESYEGKKCNVLHGHVSLANNGGFIQMAANLVHDTPATRPSQSTTSVDMSAYKGVEIIAYSDVDDCEDIDDDGNCVVIDDGETGNDNEKLDEFNIQ